MRDIRISAQLYTLRDYTRTLPGFRDTLLKIKDIGYKSFQYSGAGPLDPGDVRKCLDETGMIMSATHTAPERLQSDLANVIREHRLWECRYAGIGMMPAEYRDDFDGIVRFAHEFSEIGRKLKKEGLRLVYHNHDFEFQKYNDRLIMDILMDETDPDAFDFEIDTYWVQSGGGDPVDWIYKLDGRMQYIHFKDMAMSGRKQVFAPVGEGNLNWEKIITACEETAVEWCAVEQDTCEISPFECLRQSYENLTIKYGMEG
ncbi:MAG: sugar phosphate isomerase/epimerase [Clostridia bacterium]|nr:sugar phosphate isomerase/epimerase [Clostridia bacterium]